MITIEKWAGLVTNASPYAIPPGAAVTQVNLQCISPGQLTVRPGTTAVSFASHTGSTAPIIRAFRYPRDNENVVYQNSNGEIYVAQVTVITPQVPLYTGNVVAVTTGATTQSTVTFPAVVDTPPQTPATIVRLPVVTAAAADIPNQFLSSPTGAAVFAWTDAGGTVSLQVCIADSSPAGSAATRFRTELSSDGGATYAVVSGAVGTRRLDFYNSWNGDWRSSSTFITINIVGITPTALPAGVVGSGATPSKWSTGTSTQYRVRVTAENPSGSSAPIVISVPANASSWIDTKPGPPQLPCGPRRLLDFAKGLAYVDYGAQAYNGSVLVSWTAPDMRGSSAITKYTIYTNTPSAGVPIEAMERPRQYGAEGTAYVDYTQGLTRPLYYLHDPLITTHTVTAAATSIQSNAKGFIPTTTPAFSDVFEQFGQAGYAAVNGGAEFVYAGSTISNPWPALVVGDVITLKKPGYKLLQRVAVDDISPTSGVMSRNVSTGIVNEVGQWLWVSATNTSGEGPRFPVAAAGGQAIMPSASLAEYALISSWVSGCTVDGSRILGPAGPLPAGSWWSARSQDPAVTEIGQDYGVVDRLSRPTLWLPKIGSTNSFPFYPIYDARNGVPSQVGRKYALQYGTQFSQYSDVVLQMTVPADPVNALTVPRTSVSIANACGTRVTDNNSLNSLFNYQTSQFVGALALPANRASRSISITIQKPTTPNSRGLTTTGVSVQYSLDDGATWQNVPGSPITWTDFSSGGMTGTAVANGWVGGNTWDIAHWPWNLLTKANWAVPGGGGLTSRMYFRFAYIDSQGTGEYLPASEFLSIGAFV